MKYNEVEQKAATEEVVEVEVESKEEETKQPRKQIAQVAGKKKRKLMERLVIGMFGERGERGIGNYISQEIVLPAIKDIVVSSITSGVNMAVYGEERPSGAPYKGVNTVNHRTTTPSRTQPRTNYGGYYQGSQPTSRVTTGVGRQQQVEEYILGSRQEAEGVLNEMWVVVNSYGSASIADYYEMIGIPTAYTHNSYGWDAGDMAHAQLRKVSGGYIISFPRPRVL